MKGYIRECDFFSIKIALRHPLAQAAFTFIPNQGKPKTFQSRRNVKNSIMAHYYCEYCGQRFSSVSSLTAANCPRHPNGSGKGKHKLYEGSEKSKYTCKYCGQSFSSISSMTAANCPRHPKGSGKGKHAPAL